MKSVGSGAGCGRERRIEISLLVSVMILYINKAYATRKKAFFLAFQNIIVFIFKKNVKKIFSLSASEEESVRSFVYIYPQAGLVLGKRGVYTNFITLSEEKVKPVQYQ